MLTLTNLDKLYANLVIYFVFLFTYYSLGKKSFKGLSDQPTIHEFLYFTTTTHTTAGFGDITPVDNIGRWVVCAHCLSVLALNFLA